MGEVSSVPGSAGSVRRPLPSMHEDPGKILVKMQVTLVRRVVDAADRVPVSGRWELSV